MIKVQVSDNTSALTTWWRQVRCLLKADVEFVVAPALPGESENTKTFAAGKSVWLGDNFLGLCDRNGDPVNDTLLCDVNQYNGSATAKLPEYKSVKSYTDLLKIKGDFIVFVNQKGYVRKLAANNSPAPVFRFNSTNSEPECVPATLKVGVVGKLSGDCKQELRSLLGKFSVAYTSKLDFDLLFVSNEEVRESPTKKLDHAESNQIPIIVGLQQLESWLKTNQSKDNV